MLATVMLLLKNSLMYALHLAGNAGSFPRPLSVKEEQACLDRLAQGDLEARNTLVEHNMRLVAHVVKKYYNPTVDQDDLISIGMIGLIKGISSYRADKNVRLATYAARCIENEVLMYFRSRKKLQGEVSLSDTLETDKEGNSLLLMDVVGVEDTMLDDLDERESHLRVRKLVDVCLTDREADIIKRRYGLGGIKPLTQRELAGELGISRSYVLSRVYGKYLVCVYQVSDMKYSNFVRATFLTRPNRFVATVALNGREEIVHVKNTGRCRELLVPGCTVYLNKSDNPLRKTAYDLVAVEKGDKLINMDAQAPNSVFGEWAAKGMFRSDLTLLRAETKWGNSRFDFYWEAGDDKGFVEVKGCTLEENGVALFPDAPTERGVKHLRELAAAQREGYICCVCFVLQMKGCHVFQPNERMHAAFAEALRDAEASGVRVMAVDCLVTPDSLEIDCEVPVKL